MIVLTHSHICPITLAGPPRPWTQALVHLAVDRIRPTLSLTSTFGSRATTEEVHECLEVRAAPPGLTSLACCSPGGLSHTLEPLAGCRPRRSRMTPARRFTPLPRCVVLRLPLTISRTMTTPRASSRQARGSLWCHFMAPLPPLVGLKPSSGAAWLAPRLPCGASGAARALGLSSALRAWPHDSYVRPRAIGCGAPEPQPHSQLAAGRAPPVLGRSTCC